MHHFATFWALNRRQAAAKWHSHNFVFSSIGKRECFVTLFFPPCLYIYIYMYVPSHFGFGKATCFKFKSSYNDIETEPFHIHMYMYREAFFSTGKKVRCAMLKYTLFKSGCPYRFYVLLEWKKEIWYGNCGKNTQGSLCG